MYVLVVLVSFFLTGSFEYLRPLENYSQHSITKQSVQQLCRCIEDIDLEASCPQSIFTFVEALSRDVIQEFIVFLQQYLHNDYFKRRCKCEPREVIMTPGRIQSFSINNDDLCVIFSDSDALLYKQADRDPFVFHYPHVRVTALLQMDLSSLIGLSDGSIEFHTPTNRYRINIHEKAIVILARTLDGLIFVGSQSGDIKLIDSRLGTVKERLSGHISPIVGMVNTIDGNIISASYDGAIKVWNRKKKLLGETIYHAESPIRYILEIGHDILLVCKENGSVALINKDSGLLLGGLYGHIQAVTCASITEQGNIVTVSKDRTIKIWHPKYNTCLFSFDAHDDAINALAVNFNGDIISGSNDGVIKIWDCNDTNPFSINNLLQLLFLVRLEMDLVETRKVTVCLSDDWYTVFQTLPESIKKYYTETFFKSKPIKKASLSS